MSLLSWIRGDSNSFLESSKKPFLDTEKNQSLWTRCNRCGVILYVKHLKENQRVCFSCDYHLPMNSQERLETLLDPNTWRPLDEILSPCDPLHFTDQKTYAERLLDAQNRTGLQDGVQTGTGMLNGIPIAIAFLDFNFLSGTIGSVVGEKITRLIEYATDKGLFLIIFSTSGGTRIQEGTLSLMQLAKINAALKRYQSDGNLLYISVLASPTTGGATASFALLGDLVIAEPNSLIGFAGRRLIEQTVKTKLPEQFQTAEYFLSKGFIDLIIPRIFLRQALVETLSFYKKNLNLKNTSSSSKFYSSNSTQSYAEDNQRKNFPKIEKSLVFMCKVKSRNKINQLVKDNCQKKFSVKLDDKLKALGYLGLIKQIRLKAHWE